jgi:hypothetical protein
MYLDNFVFYQYIYFFHSSYFGVYAIIQYMLLIAKSCTNNDDIIFFFRKKKKKKNPKTKEKKNHNLQLIFNKLFLSICFLRKKNLIKIKSLTNT